ncbi:MAG: hypothetical protein EBR82_66775 [Caulobacteraceae bacterium]|nr:hypothetical protein [Caulobacteraceae bacterium]
MKQTLTTHQIADALHSDKNASWTWSGALALAKHLEEIEESTGEEMELDVVAIRCDFSEHETLQDWANDHFGGEAYALERLPDLEDETISDYIHDHGTLIEFDGGVIVSSF